MNKKTPVEDNALQARAISAIFTDGACKGNPGWGGWGVQIQFTDGSIQELGGRSDDNKATNNRMEMQAVIAVLDYLLETSPDVSDGSSDAAQNNQIKLYTDSTYVLNGIAKGLVHWDDNRWKTLKNSDLWTTIDTKLKALVNKLDIQIVPEYVEAHTQATDPTANGNRRVDSIASDFAVGKSVDLQQRSPLITKFVFKNNEQELNLKLLRAAAAYLKNLDYHKPYRNNQSELESTNLNLNQDALCKPVERLNTYINNIKIQQDSSQDEYPSTKTSSPLSRYNRAIYNSNKELDKHIKNLNYLGAQTSTVSPQNDHIAPPQTSNTPSPEVKRYPHKNASKASETSLEF